MFLRQIFDPYLAQSAYLVGCPRSGEALIIDPQRDIDRYDALAAENGLQITAATETHIHADFVSGVQEFAARPHVRILLSGEGGPDWTYRWSAGRPDVHLLTHGAHFSIGGLRIDVLHTPGHTPEHLSFLITDLGGGATAPIALATGDFVFVGDVGRPDLLESAAGQRGSQEPSARALRASLHDRLAPFADYLQLLPAHGAGSACGKALGAIPTTTLGYERRFNSPLKLALADADAFVRDILSGQPEPPPYFATMKRVNRDGVAITGGPPPTRRLDAREFAQLAGAPSVTILDARAHRADFDAAHHPRSLFAPLRSPFFTTAAGSYLEPPDRILLLLERAADADLAARQLHRIGYDHVVGWLPADEAHAARLLTTSLPRIDLATADLAAFPGEILDVRSAAEFAESHLPGARSIPYTQLRSRLGELPLDQLILVHCGTGKRSALAASFLRRHGFSSLHGDGSPAMLR